MSTEEGLGPVRVLAAPGITATAVANRARAHRLVYSVAEAARLLDISRAFAYELVARGELPVIRLGRRRLVPKVALMALVGPLSDALPE